MDQVTDAGWQEAAKGGTIRQASRQVDRPNTIRARPWDQPLALEQRPEGLDD